MSEIIWQDAYGRGVTISKFAGPARTDGGSRTQIQIHVDRSERILQLTLEEMLALSAGLWNLIHASGALPLCLRIDCTHTPPHGHGRYSDCPSET